jgi:hypothetical protein
MQINQLNRFQAFCSHLLGSIVVGLCSTALVFLVWYPWPLPAATGVTAIFAILLSVDVVIGPCITLIVFNPKKRELKRDLAIVLLLQISALLYGMHTVFVARPVYYVFSNDRFDLVFANDLTPEKLDKVTDARFRSTPWLMPEVIAARSPDDTEARNKVLFSALAGGDDLPQLPQYYVPYADQKEQVQERIHPLEELKLFNKERGGEIAALIAKYSLIKDGIGYLPLKGKVADLTVIVRKDSAEVLEVKDIKPW